MQLTVIERELDELLGLAAALIDVNHCRHVDERYRHTLDYAEVDQPPLVVQAAFGGHLSPPKPWAGFRRYSYREAFDDPAAMMQNMLLARVVPGLILKDDSPLAIRNDHGTIQIASLLGGAWRLHEDNYPWVAPFRDMAAIERIAGASHLDTANSVLKRTQDTLAFYNAKLSRCPALKELVQISLPDLQGPMDTAEQLWGSDIYCATVDSPELLNRLLARIVDVMIDVSSQYRPLAHDRLAPFAGTQHGYVVPGRLMVRNDSSIMLSPAMYAEHVRPHDERLLRAVGTGAIHFCGNGRHLVEEMLKIEPLRGLDFGEPNLMDVQALYAMCAERKVAVTNLRPSRDDLISGKAARDCPTGAVFVYLAGNMDDARDVVRAYRTAGKKMTHSQRQTEVLQ